MLSMAVDALSAMRPTNDLWCPNYPDDRVKVYVNENWDFKEGRPTRCWVVGVTGNGSFLGNKGFWDRREALNLFEEICKWDVVNIRKCMKVGLEF